MLSKGVVKLKGWRRSYRPDSVKCQREIEMAVQAVFSKWNQGGKPSTLLDIYRFVLPKIEEQHTLGMWRWSIPSKRTIDRRTNEAADPRFYPKGVPKIVSVTAGVYTVNPELLEDVE